MKLKDLLELADGDTFLQLVDVNSEQYIEADADKGGDTFGRVQACPEIQSHRIREGPDQETGEHSFKAEALWVFGQHRKHDPSCQ